MYLYTADGLSHTIRALINIVNFIHSGLRVVRLAAEGNDTGLTTLLLTSGCRCYDLSETSDALEILLVTTVSDPKV